MAGIPIAETTDIEYKSQVEKTKPKSWLKTVSAFANTAGGTIVFGVDDDTHEEIGIKNPQQDAEYVSQSIRDRIDPVPRFAVTTSHEGDSSLLVVSIEPGIQTPHYYHADGRQEAYVRMGSSSVLASPRELNELILKGANRTYDGLSSTYKADDASFTVLRAMYKFRTGEDFTENDFASFGLVDDCGMLTNAGVLLADEPLVRHSRVFCTRWTGLYKDDAADDAEFSGSLLLLLREGEAFVKRHNRTSWEKTPDSRMERPSYSERAVTEALVNALIHRDYLIAGSEVHIDIYDDRLELTSPGMMFEGGSLPENVLTDSIPSLRRNPILADVFQRMRFMERRGSGLRKICQATMNEENFEERFMPTFEERDGFFLVTLWDMNHDATYQATPLVEGVNPQVNDPSGQSTPPSHPPSHPP